MNVFTPQDWYWKNAAGVLYGSKKNAALATTDADYVVWTKAGNYATIWPRDASGNQTTASLNAVLESCGLPDYVPATQA